MSEQQPEQKKKEEVEEEYETTVSYSITYKGRSHALVHIGASGTEYMFARNRPVRLHPDDVEAYKRRAEKNPNNWELTITKNVVNDEIYQFKFKGTDNNPDKIELNFDDPEELGRKKKYVFPANKWIEVNDEYIIEILGRKAIQSSSRVWEQRIIHRPRVKKISKQQQKEANE